MLICAVIYSPSYIRTLFFLADYIRKYINIFRKTLFKSITLFTIFYHYGIIVV
ncbi:uncharacterized protein BX663DRAFT_526105 [Cokeromyces recurvatus]|uniref:uncharacterized protein n=1 Tax=Cokeromyces recurvatus TaxID=90255 RepID=UPI00221F987A|nr:uncharacterized protein BX663DRAFT_526105 [Cokeromyces recurvatus]KAI7898078.1 hypothetical protein BX663DRAFT_526105 [Cokeromyces recurvatus]